MKVGNLSDQILPDYHNKTLPKSKSQRFSSTIKSDLLLCIIATLFRKKYFPVSVKKNCRKRFTLEKIAHYLRAQDIILQKFWCHEFVASEVIRQVEKQRMRNVHVQWPSSFLNIPGTMKSVADPIYIIGLHIPGS